ncbi:hypothetical protein B0H10DRAFT_1954231 [Mycena sp. CBHHK59/15]|nr:hypothetical protein B0H10DRAFT_1954231 [Mycena sp. CBHHK59/15]
MSEDVSLTEIGYLLSQKYSPIQVGIWLMFLTYCGHHVGKEVGGPREQRPKKINCQRPSATTRRSQIKRTNNPVEPCVFGCKPGPVPPQTVQNMFPGFNEKAPLANKICRALRHAEFGPQVTGSILWVRRAQQDTNQVQVRDKWGCRIFFFPSMKKLLWQTKICQAPVAGGIWPASHGERDLDPEGMIRLKPSLGPWQTGVQNIFLGFNQKAPLANKDLPCNSKTSCKDTASQPEKYPRTSVHRRQALVQWGSHLGNTIILSAQR